MVAAIIIIIIIPGLLRIKQVNKPKQGPTHKKKKKKKPVFAASQLPNVS